MHIRKLFILCLMIIAIPTAGYAGIFPPDNGRTLLCGIDRGKHFKVDITLFPKTLRVNGTFLELQSSVDANDGFKVGIYKQAGGVDNAMLAVKDGFKPVLIENSATYVCS